MENTRNKSFFELLPIVLIVGIALVGCTSGSATPTSETAAPVTTEPAMTNTTAATSTESVTNTPAVIAGDCLIGTWDLIDLTSYMDSIKSNINTDSKGDVTFTGVTTSGTATFVFNPDKTSALIADNFNQRFTMVMTVADAPVEIPISLSINGKSTADYAVEGDEITFSNQYENELMIAIDTMGSVTSLTESMFGEPGTQKLYQFSCLDANTLSLKVIAVDDMDLAPIMLTRAP